MIRRAYDIKLFDFKQIIESYLDYTNLPFIHKDYPFASTLISGTDQNQDLHKKFYNKMDNDERCLFVNTYTKFIKEVILKPYKCPMVFQTFPTFRIHQPSNLAVFGWHRDRDYNHSPHEVNYYLPITEAFGTNTFWYESEEGKKDFQPMEARYGEIIEWDGANCRHGNKPNNTGQTRISFDFRVLTKDNYEKYLPKRSITQGKKFEIGSYYSYLK
jgi:hypothetical protein|tara:strand:+ start:1511 stop:2155 length:645 start_codon:yes stop_codon:yes gene_type:complete